MHTNPSQHLKQPRDGGGDVVYGLVGVVAS